MVGCGFFVGFMFYGDVNGVVMDMVGEVLFVVKNIFVFVGVCVIDFFCMMDKFFDEVKVVGFVGV